MKVIEQLTLWNNTGNSDKVYEIDLCEVRTGQYVVNFRYGKRNNTLKDGSKTTLPVALPDAQRIFNALASEKKKGGYTETGHYFPGTTPATVIQVVVPKPVYTVSKKEFVLNCLQEAIRNPAWNQKKWSLNRIIWRCGELTIAEAVPLLLPLLNSGDDLRKYCVVWALGKCADPQAIPHLQKIYQAPKTAPFMRRIAYAALRKIETDPLAITQLSQSLLARLADFIIQTKTTATPAQSSGNGLTGFWKRTTQQLTGQTPPALSFADALAHDLRPLILAGKASEIAAFLEENLGKTITYDLLEGLYHLSPDFTFLRKIVLDCLITLPFQPGAFRTVRHIFKTAEFLEDAEVFGLLAYRFEKTPAHFSFGRYGKQYGLYIQNGQQWTHIKNPVQELTKPDSLLAYSDITKTYLQHRIRRTLHTLGEDGQTTAYTRLVTAVLLQYTDEQDKGKPAERTRTTYQWNPQTRRHDTRTWLTAYDVFAKALHLNDILFANSLRYEIKKNNKAWRCQNNYKPGDPAPETREEAFPEAWDQHPEKLLELLAHSQAQPVHQFATKALRQRTDLLPFVTLDFLVEMLQKPYPETVSFGLNLITHFYNPAQPDLDLLQMLIHHPLSEARTLAKKWIADKADYFLHSTLILRDLIVNPYPDNQDFVQQLLAGFPLNIREQLYFVSLCLAELLSLPPENDLVDAAAQGVRATLSMHFVAALSEVNWQVIQDLLHSPVPHIQAIGAMILENHQTLPQAFPEGLLTALIGSAVSQVRESGIRIFGKLPEPFLLENEELIQGFCLSPFPEIRRAILPVVQRLALSQPGFGRKLLAQLLPYLQRKELYEGLHNDLFNTIETALPQFLAELPMETTLQLLHSSRQHSQRLGFFLLKNYLNPDEMSMRQVVRLASHEVQEVRAFGWHYYQNHIPRIKYEAAESLRITDATWDDSRAFAFDFFRKNFSEADWQPELLISLCDSTRTDVQQFGKEQLTTFFRQENGEQYLLQLSQHPAQSIQTFATSYLEQFASGNADNINKLETYFITVLSRVNKSGVAKARIFEFLEKEALQHEALAQGIANILARQSATVAVADKAHCIRILHNLLKKYPSLQMPLRFEEPVLK